MTVLYLSLFLLPHKIPILSGRRLYTRTILCMLFFHASCEKNIQYECSQVFNVSGLHFRLCNSDSEDVWEWKNRFSAPLTTRSITRQEQSWKIMYKKCSPKHMGDNQWYGANFMLFYISVLCGVGDYLL